MLDPSDIVLLLIDHQEPILARSKTNSVETIRKGVSVLSRAAKLLDIPVVLSAVEPSDGRLRFLSQTEGTPLIRTQPNALADPETLATIRATGRKHIAIGAVLTEVAGYAAASAAREDGFEVTLLLEVCGGFSPRSEDATFAELRAKGVRVLPIASLFAPFISDFAIEPGKTLLPLIRETYA